MTGLYTTLVSSVLFPLQERLKGHDTVRIRRALEESQWWPRERLEAYQAERLRRLIERAYAHVPYYRRVMGERGLTPADVRTPADLIRLPFLTKADIRAHSDALRADDARGLARFNTGGSTGEPLIFYIGAERVSHDVAAKWRATRWWGVDIGDPEAVVWGSPIELGAQDRLRGLRDRVMRTRLFPAFEMSEARVDGFIDGIRALRPRMVFGYPSSISLIARRARARGVGLDDLGVKVVFVTAEKLYDDQAETIRRAFACPVANGYGGRDAGFLAHQCPEGGLHVTAEDVVLEIVGPDGQVLPPGEAGEVVVTHLATGDFPFVRYRTGDVAVLDDRACACGRGLPVLREVQGRATDFVVAADGTVMHGLALVYVIRDIEGVRAFRILQESLAETRVTLVRDAGAFPADGATRIVEGLRRRLGEGVAVHVDFAEAIPPERSGKYRYVQSKVAPAW
jgi:phenylacetate-CoA ligase